MTPGKLRACAAFGACALGLAQAPTLEELQAEADFLRLLQTRVITATKDLQEIREAPSIVSVITAEELHRSGATSVGEALQSVPGLYGVYDFLGYNVGVRGINGGPRAYGRILKVLIDGQPVAFRSDSANTLGPELLPLELVDRIEIVRGPASALYGANAFLGAVNILTRSGGGGAWVLRGERLLGRGGGGLEAVVEGSGLDWGGIAGLSASDSDRSGHELPSSSPILRTQPPQETVSRGDRARPASFYGRTWWRPGGGLRLELTGHLSRLDSYAEWLDFGTLSHQNRVVLDQGFGRLRADWAPNEAWSFMAYLARAQGQPGSDERLSSGSTTSYPRRVFGFGAWDAGLEARVHLAPLSSLVVGLDLSRDDERLLEVYTVQAGAEILTSRPQGRLRFDNTGAYAQLQARPWPAVALTANLRFDHHNVYGDATTFRLAAVADLGRGLRAKLLYGSSFKAPAALQLYAQPLYARGTVGNPDPRPETARTLEGGLRWRAGERLEISVNAFRNRVADKVELVPSGTEQQPQNVGSQRSTGLEGELKLVRGIHTVYLNASYQRTDDVRRDPFYGELSAPSTLYPGLMSLLRWQARLSQTLTLHADLRQVGPRRASKSNIERNYLEPYALGGYALVDVVGTGQWGAHRFQARVRNLLDRRTAEPGAGGYDIPGLRRQWVLAYAHSF